MFSKNTNILIVDDMPTIRDLVKSQLKSMGYKYIFEAADGHQALSLLVQHQASQNPISLIISDWNMPKMTGLDLLRQVRASKDWANTPFILLTSESERDQVTEAVLEGASQYIIKPFTGKVFEEKLRSAWGKHA